YPPIQPTSGRSHFSISSVGPGKFGKRISTSHNPQARAADTNSAALSFLCSGLIFGHSKPMISKLTAVTAKIFPITARHLVRSTVRHSGPTDFHKDLDIYVHPGKHPLIPILFHPGPLFGVFAVKNLRKAEGVLPVLLQPFHRPAQAVPKLLLHLPGDPVHVRREVQIHVGSVVR